MDPNAPLLLAIRSTLLRLVHALYLTHAAFCECTLRLFAPAPPSSVHPPAHLGIVLNDGEQNLRRLSELICWCAAAGVQRMTVCDTCGGLLAASAALAATLQASGSSLRLAAGSGERYISTPDAPGAALLVAGEGELVVRIVSAQTGRDDLVGAARRLCARVCDGTLAVDAIDEEAMEAEVTVNDGFPEPVRRAEGIDARRSPAARPPARPESARVRSQDLVLQFCPELLLGGLLPWHCRITQYAAHLPPSQSRHPAPATLLLPGRRPLAESRWR